MRLVVGLGNPGPRYAGTRHNAGFLVVDELARRHGASFRAGRHGEEARLGRVRLLKPQTFMNRSGAAVQAVATKNGIPPEEILVVHDDLDLPLGRLRVRRGGGAGGQKGVRDIIDRLGPDFARLKIGIDRPPTRWTTEHWVLSRFRDDEAELVERVVDAAADGVEALLRDGVDAASNAVNGRDLRDDADADADAAPTVDGDETDVADPDR
ncbi:MAG: aminoacyl-tRNA hydrolase [Deinococcus-Thermus bacterium]|nr:aminoacyl-tRNA hydrolase [Deinococcota bacterium]